MTNRKYYEAIYIEKPDIPSLGQLLLESMQDSILSCKVSFLGLEFNQ